MIDANSTSAGGYLTQAQVGERIAHLRAEQDVSQRRLAEIVGVDPSALSRIESGDRGLAVSELTALAEFFGVSIDGLLRAEVEPAPLFRSEGGPKQAGQAAEQFAAVVEDFFAFEAAVRS